MYGGTKTEMERLIADANKLREANGQAGDLTIEKFSDVVQAIHEVQEAQGIMGNSAREASETIAGSVQMAKAAWDNLMAGLGDEFISDEELSSLINDFIDSIAIVAENILPVITTIGTRIVEYLPGALSKLGEALQPVLETALVYAWNSAVAVLGSFGIQLPEIDFNSLDSAKEKISSTVEEIKNAVQPIAEVVGNAFGGAISILSRNIDLVIPAVVGLVTALKSFEFVSGVAAAVSAFSKALEAAKLAQEGATTAQILLNAVMSANPMVLIITVIAGLVAALITLWVTNEDFRNAVIGIWEGIKQFFSDSCEAIKGFFGGAWDWITNKFNEALAFISGVPGKIQAFFNVLPSLLSAIFNIALNYAKTVFSNIVSSCSNSINNVKNFFGQIPGAVSQAFQSAYNAVREKIDGVVNFVRGAVDKVVGFFKNMRIEIPHIKLPHFSISGKFSLDPPQIPHISVDWYAKGGIFTGPQVIGVGEAGPEAVIPIKKLKSFIGEQTSVKDERNAPGSITIQIDQFINNDTEKDIDALFDLINQKLARNEVVYA